MVVFINGSFGIGKTTVSRLLADEVLSYLRDRGVPALHLCLTAPHSVVLERLHARQSLGPTPWQLRRSAECCAAHQAREFGEHVPAGNRTAREVANDIAARIRSAARTQ